MEENFWKRKGAKGAIFLAVLDILVLILFFYSGFIRGLAEAYWFLLFMVLVDSEGIIRVFANLPEPPRIFYFLTSSVPIGAFVCYFISLIKSEQETQLKIAIVTLIILILWNAVNIGYGIWKKKRSAL